MLENSEPEISYQRVDRMERNASTMREESTLERNSALFRLQIGRSELVFPLSRVDECKLARAREGLALTRRTRQLIERVALCVQYGAPVLLVGETGSGKTAAVQYLARLCLHSADSGAHGVRSDHARTSKLSFATPSPSSDSSTRMGLHAPINRKLIVINMSYQTDLVDLFGGFKPLDSRQLVQPLLQLFEELFLSSFSRIKNLAFLEHVEAAFLDRNWTLLFSLIQHVITMAKLKFEEPNRDTSGLLSHWNIFASKLVTLREQIGRAKQRSSPLAFKFIQGTFLRFSLAL